MVLEDIPGHKEHYHHPLRMIAATILGLISIVSIFEWYEKPLNIHLLILAIISIFIMVRQIVIMTYES